MFRLNHIFTRWSRNIVDTVTYVLSWNHPVVTIVGLSWWYLMLFHAKAWMYWPSLAVVLGLFCQFTGSQRRFVLRGDNYGSRSLCAIITSLHLPL